MKKIYVVTPCFNAIDTIERTLDSVANQVGDSIVIHYHVQDGGSNDGTIEVVKNFASKTSKYNNFNFTYSFEPDSGMYDALVKGFNNFKDINDESWMTWINSDDFLETDSFKTVISVDELNPKIEWLTGRVSILELDGNLNRPPFDNSSTVCLRLGLCNGVYWTFLQQEGTFFKFSLWKKLDKKGEFSAFKYAGDWNLWRVFAKHSEVYCVDKVLGNFCKREGQISQSKRSEYMEEIYRTIPEHEMFKRFSSLESPINCNLYHQTNNSFIFVQKDLTGHKVWRSEKLKKETLKRISADICVSTNYYIYDALWQFPAITEQHAAIKIKDYNPFGDGILYFGFPWATYIDLKENNKGVDQVELALKALVDMLPRVQGRIVTVCQHIYAGKYFNLFKSIGITDVFWSHAVKGEATIAGINVHPFPLYPVQYGNGYSELEDRNILFSFVGAKSNQFYLSNARNIIIDSLSSDSRGVVTGRDRWHYEKVVYDYQIKKVNCDKDVLVDKRASSEFVDLLRRSVFSLCPSGSGPNSIRLWESIGLGSVPVILANTYLPPGNQALWDEAVVYCEETEEAISALPEMLECISRDVALLARKRHAMRQLWMLYGPDCFIYDILKLMLDSKSHYKNGFHSETKSKFKLKIKQLVDLNVGNDFLCSALISRILVEPDLFSLECENCDETQFALSSLLDKKDCTLALRLRKVAILKGLVV